MIFFKPHYYIIFFDYLKYGCVLLLYYENKHFLKVRIMLNLLFFKGPLLKPKIRFEAIFSTW